MMVSIEHSYVVVWDYVSIDQNRVDYYMVALGAVVSEKIITLHEIVKGILSGTPKEEQASLNAINLIECIMSSLSRNIR
jgi:hypothetical protein